MGVRKDAVAKKGIAVNKGRRKAAWISLRNPPARLKLVHFRLLCILGTVRGAGRDIKREPGWTYWRGWGVSEVEDRLTQSMKEPKCIAA